MAYRRQGVGVFEAAELAPEGLLPVMPRKSRPEKAAYLADMGKWSYPHPPVGRLSSSRWVT